MTTFGVPIRKTAPGPESYPLAGAPVDSPLDFLVSLTREYGDVVQYATGYGPVYLVNHPDYIGYVFQDKNFIRTQLLKLALGDGLITSEGAYWRSQRRLAQPAFHQKCIANFEGIIHDATVRMLRSWEPSVAVGQPVEMAAEMTRLTLEIIGKALFSVDLSGSARALGEAIAILIEDLGHLGRTLFTARYRMSPSRNQVFETALQTVDRTIYDFINARRRQNTTSDDLLSLLMSGRNEETGEGLTDRQLRDEVVTMLVAGHETTANMLAWTWYLLSENPAVERRLHAELSEVLGQRLPALQDLARLPFNRMVLQESLRLYPPVWFIAPRKPLVDDKIGDYEVPANSLVVVSPYTVHRHERYWENPERFDPERFTAERSAGRPRHAYIPFGAGHHLCLGNNLAMTEGQLVLAAVAQCYRLRVVEGHPVEPEPLVTLRHRHGLPMTLARRSTPLDEHLKTI